MAVESFAVNTLIIPMDVAYQNSGMWLAYGLVYRLLSNGIPVKWAIRPGKPYDGADFTASAQDLQSGSAISGHGYGGGPFIVDASYYSQALPLVTAWQAANPATRVHRATAPFTAPVAATMHRAPRIAVEDRNASIMIGYLNAARIPDANGSTWSTSSPGVLSNVEVANGAFFGYNTTDPCRQLVYDIFLSPHTSDSDWTSLNCAELDLFLRSGGFMHATCHSIGSIENICGPFLTTTGFPSFPNKGDDGTFTVDVPDFPSAQAVSTPGKVQKLPGGAEQTWLHTSVTYRPSTRVLAHFTGGGAQYDFMVAGSYKGGTGAGKIVYEGGHQYSTDLPYSSNEDAPYLRFVYDSIFFAVARPNIVLSAAPQNIPSASTSTVTFSLVNSGGSDAAGAAVSVTLAPFAVYNMDASIPPTSVAGQTLTWNAAALAGHTGPGVILTFTASVTPPVVGEQSVATYAATYGDNFGESYSKDYCASLNVTPGAAPVVSKTPVQQTVYPNASVSWTITAGNNGTLTLNNVVITDTLPAGITFVSATPAPTSVSAGPGGTTIVVWQAPQIPASIPAHTPAGINITMNVLMPPATTAVYHNTVTLIGTDTTPVSYSVSAQADVNVVNRNPVVTVISPAGGELVCNGINIAWVAQDPDGDSLTYALEYSADGGSSFAPIASGLVGSCPPPGPPYCSYFWDTSGLPSGNNYLIRITASDGELTGQDVSASPFVIDNTPPVVSWVSPASGSTITISPVTLQATATDNVAVTGVEFLYSTDGFITSTLIGIDNSPEGNVYSVNWEPGALPAGSYQLRARAVDQCSKTAWEDISVTVDLPPQVNLLAPDGGELICPAGTSIRWVASDPNGDPLTYALYYSPDGGATFIEIASGLTGTCPAPGPPVCSYFWNTAVLPSGNNYLVKVVASDGLLTAQDVSSAPFAIDNTPPAVSWVAPAAGSYVQGLVTLSASATDNRAVAGVKFEFSSDGINFSLIADVNIPTGITYTTVWNTLAVTDGQYTLRVTARDDCNNTAQVLRNIVVDNTPPTVEIVSPPDGSEVAGQVALLIRGQDNQCLSNVRLYIDGQLVHSEDVLGGARDTEFVVKWDTAGYSEGAHVVRAVATDCAGLTAETEHTYYVNNLPEHYTQLLVDGILTIPPQKPDVEMVISFDVSTRVTHVEKFSTIDGTKVLVKGFVDMGITYAAQDSAQTEHYAHFSQPFAAMILWPDLPLDAQICPVIFVEHKQHHLQNPRTIKKSIVLFVGVKICS